MSKENKEDKEDKNIIKTFIKWFLFTSVGIVLVAGVKTLVGKRGK